MTNGIVLALSCSIFCGLRLFNGGIPSKEPNICRCYYDTALGREFYLVHRSTPTPIHPFTLTWKRDPKAPRDEYSTYWERLKDE